MTKENQTRGHDFNDMLQSSPAGAIADMIEGGDFDLPPSPSLAPSDDGGAVDVAEQHPNPRRAAGARKSNANAILGVAEGAELCHDANRVAYATVPVGAHLENWPLRSRDFKLWLAGQFYERAGGAISGQALEDSVRILEARAIAEGARHDPAVRVGRTGETLYLDLGDASWRAVEITANGWQVINRPAVKFLRTPAMRALPEPEAGESISTLRRFVNTKSEGDFLLTVAWLVAALRDRGPFPILVANGEQGTGKSVFCRMVRSLVDPSCAPIRAVPRDDRDLIVSAGNSWALAFDNLSSVPPWLSDALCRLATGGGFATRALHTDREEIIFEAQRPIILNGIPSLTDRADLADRALTIHLAPIAESERRPEDELAADFAQQAPFILGALLDAVAGALRHLPEVKLDRAPRMADFVKWITAAAPALGFESAAILRAYADNRRDVSGAAFDADPVAVAVRDFMAEKSPRGAYSGTPTQLLAALTPYVAESVRKSRLWPVTAQGLGGRIDRAAPLLRTKGFSIERRHSGDRFIIITPPEGLQPAPSAMPAAAPGYDGSEIVPD